MKCYLYAIVIALCMLLPVGAQAGITGTLTGKVTNEQGEGLIGATVKVTGTNRGAIVTRADGSFDIVQIAAGSYQVEASFIGYDKISQKVTISADATSTLNFVLKTGGGQVIDTIVVEGNRGLNKDEKGAEKSFNSDDIATIARSSLSGIVTRSAGVTTSGTGFSVRNARSEDTQVRVDGVDVGDPFSGGLGAGGTSAAPIVSQMMVEGVNVMRGGFSAEYGDALGGVVNSTIRAGKTDSYSGWVAYYTDLPALWGSQANTVELEQSNEGAGYEAVLGGEGAKLQGDGLQKIDVGVNGPIPFMKRSTFSLGAYQIYNKYPSNGYEIYDPAGTNLGQLEGQGYWQKNITGKFVFSVTDNIELTFGGSWGLTNSQSTSWLWYYANDMGVASDITGKSVESIPEKVAKQSVWNVTKENLYAKIGHIIDVQSYSIQLGYSVNSDLRSRRAVGTNDDPGFFTGFELMYPKDEYLVIDGNTAFAPGQDQLADTWESLSANGISEDGYYTSTFPRISPLTGYYEGAANASGTNNPFGTQYRTYTHGSASGFFFRESYKWELNGKYSNRIRKGDFTHDIRAGIDGSLYELHYSQNSAPYDGNAFSDVYTDKEEWGGNFYTDNAVVLARTEAPYRPYKFDLWAEDQIEYKGIILAFGLRADYFNPNSDYRLVNKSDRFIPISSDDSLFATADSKFQISPRLNVKYPISETSMIGLSYGLFFQMPTMSNMYDGFGSEAIRAGTFLGNPNMKAQKTNQYQVNFTQNIGDLYSAKVSVYYVDIYNQLGVENVAVVPDPYYQYNVNEYGNNRGVELEFGKTTTTGDPFGFDINYTLAWIRGTSDGSTSNANRPIDPYTGKLTFPLSEYPLSRDVRHRVRGTAYLSWQNDQGPSIGTIKPLENSLISLTGDWRSGVPYTVSDRNGNPLGETNANNQPDYWRVDARVSKSFNLEDWFGKRMAGTKLEIYVDMYNVTNRRAITGFYTATGDPVDDGSSLDRKIGDFSAIPYYQTANPENPSSYASNQYDDYGVRLYNEIADFNSDGVITQQEKYQSYINYLEVAMKSLGNFQAPFTIYGGVSFIF